MSEINLIVFFLSDSCEKVNKNQSYKARKHHGGSMLVEFILW